MSTAQFQEVAHCGFELKVSVQTREGNRGFSLGVSHSAPRPMSVFAVYALPQGPAVETIQLGGIGQQWNAPPVANCIPVFIGSDTEGRFGHECPACGSYWRSAGAGMRWPMSCAYCGQKGRAHSFLTKGQRAYVEAVCDWVNQAMESTEDGERTIKLDDIADQVSKGAERPKFYYVEESQQNKFVCAACGHWNDILGRFGYCTSCATWNGFQELERSVAAAREQINTATAWDSSVRELVGTFDSVARQYAKQLVQRVPLTQKRRSALERVLFHDLAGRSADLKEVFDIDLLKGVSPADVAFASMMFHRRHIYEHNGGEADERYLAATGDTSVRLKQVIVETRENAHRLAGLVVRIGRNLHDGFHELFPADDGPIALERARNTRRKA